MVRDIAGYCLLVDVLWLERLYEGTQQPFVDRLVFAEGNRESIKELLCCGRNELGQLWSFGTLCHSGASAKAQAGANASATLKERSGFWFVPC
jgi:hypothetical protein